MVILIKCKTSTFLSDPKAKTDRRKFSHFLNSLHQFYEKQFNSLNTERIKPVKKLTFMHEIAAVFTITDTLPSTVKLKAALSEFNTTTAHLPTRHTVNTVIQERAQNQWLKSKLYTNVQCYIQINNLAMISRNSASWSWLPCTTNSITSVSVLRVSKVSISKNIYLKLFYDIKTKKQTESFADILPKYGNLTTVTRLPGVIIKTFCRTGFPP